jgi:hypothetical protein
VKAIIAAIIALAFGTTFVHAQSGLLSWQNAAARPTTNTTYYAPGYPSTTGAVSGWTSRSSFGLYYFMLLTATSTTSEDYGNPLGPDWNVVTYASGGIAYGTNNVAAGSVTGMSGTAGFASDLTLGITYDDMVVGWSASLGTAWDQVLPQVETGDWITQGYFGYSNVGTITPAAYPASGTEIFSGTSAQQGQTILYFVEPEPTTLALFGLGGLSMLFLRRRKNQAD